MERCSLGTTIILSRETIHVGGINHENIYAKPS